MTRGRTPLWSALGAQNSLFYFYSEVHGGHGDSVLSSITLNRGNGSTVAGLSSATGTVVLNRELPSLPSRDLSCKVQLTLYGAELLGRLVGLDPALIQDRLTGRIAGQTITDNGRRRHTTLELSDWLTMLPMLDYGASIARGDSLSALARANIFSSRLPLPELKQYGGAFHRPVIADPATDTLTVSTGDVWGKYWADLGHFAYTSRSGSPVIYSHNHRKVQGDNVRSSAPQPLLRSQVNKPVSWEQPITVPAQIAYTYLNPSNGQTNYDVVTIGESSYVTKAETLDLTYVHVDAGVNGLRPAMIARAARQAADTYKVTNVSVDMLGLLRRLRRGDRGTIGQLLKLEIGDPLILSHDWPAEASGIYFAHGITETIARDTWRIDLQLTPYRHVTGAHPTADIAGETWDTRFAQITPWNTPTQTWEDTPA